MGELSEDAEDLRVGEVSPLRILFTVRIRSYIPIWVALFLMDAMPRLISFGGRCTPSIKKFDKRPVACLMALLSMPSISVSCRSVKTPRCVALYLDLRSYSITGVLYEGFIFRFPRAFASFRTSVVILVRCSRKSRTVLMCTPSIL